MAPYSLTIHTVRLFLHAYWALRGLTFAASSGDLPGLLINLEKAKCVLGIDNIMVLSRPVRCREGYNEPWNP